MKKSSFHSVILLCFSIALIQCGGVSEEEYAQSIKEHRDAIDVFMRSADASPFLSGDLPFQPLDYFSPDPSFNIIASYQPIGNRKVRNLTTSNGQEEAYEEYGYAFFDLNGQHHQLLILKNLNAQADFFIPFADASNGQSTYGGGRYLNVPMGNIESTIELDFNKAYNPYCAYNATYICPLPPASNILRIPILAGEKNYTTN
jgi:uncharacterized protein (DUF1684 family)